jgi:hypothetical protein
VLRLPEADIEYEQSRTCHEIDIEKHSSRITSIILERDLPQVTSSLGIE